LARDLVAQRTAEIAAARTVSRKFAPQ
jgi:hypothetical protein